MKTFSQYFIESNELAIIDSDFSNLSFEGFLQQLTTDPQTGRPITLKSLQNKASWLSLYMGNKYGFSSRDGKDAIVAKLIGLINTYFFQRIMWPKTQPLRDKKDDIYATPEYTKYHAGRAKIFKDIMYARRAGENLDELYSYKAEYENNCPFKSELTQLDKKIDQYTIESEQTPITSEYFEPSDEVNGETFTRAYNLFESLKAQK